MLNYQVISANLPSELNIVLMHGLFGESGNLMNIAKVLQESLNATVVVPDMLSHGLSVKREHMTYSLMAEYVEGLISHLNLNFVVLVGHSMGGKIAMQMIERARHAYLAVVIADIAPVDYPLIHTPIFDAMLHIDNALSAGEIQQRKQADAMLMNAVPEVPLRQFLLKNLKRNNEKQWAWQFGLSQLAGSYPELAQAPLHHGNASDIPCLVIKGGLSDYIQVSAEAAFNARFNDISFKIIQGVGHWLHAEKPQLFTRIITQFIQSKIA